MFPSRSSGEADADLDEQLVTDVVAQAVVDLFEPVQVQQQQRRRGAGAVSWALTWV